MEVQTATEEEKAAFLAMVKSAAEALEAEPGDAEDKVVAVLSVMVTLAAAGEPKDEQESQQLCDQMRATLAEYKAAQA